MDEALKKLRERCKRTVLRKIETGEVTYDHHRKVFILKDTDEEYKVENKGEDEDDDDNNDDENSDEEDDDDDDEKPTPTFPHLSEV